MMNDDIQTGLVMVVQQKMTFNDTSKVLLLRVPLSVLSNLRMQKTSKLS